MFYLIRKTMFAWMLVVGLMTGSKGNGVPESSMATGTTLNLCLSGQPGNAADMSGVALIFASILDSDCSSPLSDRILDVSMEGNPDCKGVARTDPSGHLTLIVTMLSKTTSTSGYPGGSLRFCLNETECGWDRPMAEVSTTPGSDLQQTTGVVRVKVCVGHGSRRVQRSIGGGTLGPRRSRFAGKGKISGGSGMVALKGGGVVRRNGEEENDWDKIPMEWIKRGKSRAGSSSGYGKNSKGKKPRMARDLERVLPNTESRDRHGQIKDFLASPEVQSWKSEMETHGRVNGRGNSDSAGETIGITAEKNALKGSNSRETGMQLGSSKKWDDSGLAWIKRDPMKKWDDSGLAWMKKNSEKKWDDSGLAWMKKNSEKKLDDPGMAYMKKDSMKKWDDSGLAWMKKDTEKKWDDSGLAWMKKDTEKKWDDSGLAWMKKDAEKKWDDSGLAWMKKDAEKKWDDSGLAWMKKDTDKKWDDSGLAWMKKDTVKKWDDSGLAWMKKKDTVKKWDDSGLAWMKKNSDKRWDDVGLTWIKKSDPVSAADFSSSIAAAPTKVIQGMLAKSKSAGRIQSPVNPNRFSIPGISNHIKAKSNRK